MIIRDTANNEITLNIKGNTIPFIADQINYTKRIDLSLQKMAKELRKLGYTGQIKGLIHADVLLRELNPKLANELSYLSSYYFIKQIYRNDDSLVIELFQTDTQALTNHFGHWQTAPQLLLTQFQLMDLYPQYGKRTSYAALI